jgi:hypothetical protein
VLYPRLDHFSGWLRNLMEHSAAFGVLLRTAAAAAPI